MSSLSPSGGLSVLKEIYVYPLSYRLKKIPGFGWRRGARYFWAAQETIEDVGTQVTGLLMSLPNSVEIPKVR